MSLASDRTRHGVLTVFVITEQVCKQVIGRGDAFAAVEAVFAAMAKGDAWNFPVVREAIGYADALYGFKSGFDKAGLSLGLKIYDPHCISL